MAVVYLARDLRHGRDVAVKVFTVEGGPLDGAPRFLHEIQVAARLSHPNILPLHDSGETEGILYYVMPFVPGESLRQRLEREGALPVSDALAIASEVAGALAYAHSHGVIHRDVKPENILFVAGHAVVADFGIARAISAGGWDEHQLGQGMVGTPAYMSPEQARGGSRVDGRSDVYSLGCVLYEMLTGTPAFRGSTPEELVVQQLEVDPEPVYKIRPALPPDLQAMVGRALAKHPADRYQTAQVFAEELVRLSGSISSPALAAAPAAAPPRTGRGPVYRWLLPAIATAAIGYALLHPSLASRREPVLDASRYMVAPFVHEDGAAPLLFSGEQCARLVHAALARWRDVELVDTRWTSDRLTRLGHQPTLDELVQLAREGGAGRLVTGELYPLVDSVRVRGVLYDTRGPGVVLHELTITLPGTLADVGRHFATLADSLLLPEARTGLAAGGAVGTDLMGAWSSYDSGHVALERWNLPEAERLFSRALALDPGYAQARLWLAQAEDWEGRDPEEWRDRVLAALGSSRPLPSAERDWALALAALGQGRYQEACERYDAMIRRDSLDFRAWYGRGECQADDGVVVPDAKSRTGWRFRASYQGALADFERALTLVPASFAAFRGASYERLNRMLILQPNRLRLGWAESDSSIRYVAFAGLDHDTLTFVPYPEASLDDFGVEAGPSTSLDAIRWTRQGLRRITTAWARAYPANAAAVRAEAYSLELVGELGGDSTISLRAADGFRRARGLATNPADSLQLALDELRVLLKTGQFSEAGRYATAMLASSQANQPELAPVALLAGQPILAARLNQLGAPGTTYYSLTGARLAVPLQLRKTVLGLEAYASLGAPGDSIRATLGRIDRELDGLIERNERSRYESALLDRNLSLLTPVMNLPRPVRSAGSDYILEMQEAMARGDTATVRRQLDEIARQRRMMRPADVALEATYLESLLQLQVGDTAGAVRRIDAVLGSLSAAGSDIVSRLAAAGGMLRLMELRARLAAHAGEADVSRQWAGSVVALWSRPEPVLRAQYDSLKALAGGS